MVLAPVKAGMAASVRNGITPEARERHGLLWECYRWGVAWKGTCLACFRIRILGPTIHNQAQKYKTIFLALIRKRRIRSKFKAILNIIQSSRPACAKTLS